MRVLVVAHSPSVRNRIASILRRDVTEVHSAATGLEATARLRRSRPDLVLIDMALPEDEGPALFSEIRSAEPGASVIALAETPDQAEKFVVRGANSVLVRPFSDDDLREAVAVARLKAGKDGPGVPPMLGSSPAFRALKSSLLHAARAKSTVCISGESGTGKTLAARHLHDMSERAARPFLEINCAALSAGGASAAADAFAPIAGGHCGGGTIFLDNVEDLGADAQSRIYVLLRDHASPETGDGDVPRVISATSSDLHRRVIEGHFRPDLYHFLQAIPIHLPPLRDRGRDVIEIAESRLGDLHRSGRPPLSGLSPDVADTFIALRWNGNIREVFNVLTTAARLSSGPLLTADALPPGLLESLKGEDQAQAIDGPARVVAGSWSGLTLAQIERRVIEATLDRLNGSIPQAARMLGVSPSTLYRKLEAWVKADETASVR